jgi:hypothetical protein
LLLLLLLLLLPLPLLPLLHSTSSLLRRPDACSPAPPPAPTENTIWCSVLCFSYKFGLLLPPARP